MLQNSRPTIAFLPLTACLCTFYFDDTGRYPNAVDGVIAASAPIWSFDGLVPAYDFNAFNQVLLPVRTVIGDVGPV